jgi:hypothetical protein
MPVSEYLARWSSREISEVLALRMLDYEAAEDPEEPEAETLPSLGPRELTPEEILALLDADKEKKPKPNGRTRIPRIRRVR